MEGLEGLWICPQHLVHGIRKGVLFWGDGKQGASPEPLPFRADNPDKFGRDHFSVGRRRRRGPPSTLRRCILRSECSLQWMSPCMQETWARYVPTLASLDRIELILPAGPDGAEPVEVDVSKATNMQQVRTIAYYRVFAKVKCMPKEVVLVEPATGRLLSDACDVATSAETTSLRVSTQLAELVSTSSLELVYADGRSCELDLAGIFTLRELVAQLAKHTSRPQPFVSLFLMSEGGERRPLSCYDSLDMSGERVTIQVVLAETVAELWLSGRVAFVCTNGVPLDADLSTVHTLDDLRDAVGSCTSRPSRFVRVLLEDESGVSKEVSSWDASKLPQVDNLTLAVELAPTIAELFSQHHVGLISALSGEPFPLDAETVGSLVSIQDLREAIARHRGGIRATNVKLLMDSSGEQLWDAQPFDLLDFVSGTGGGAVQVCIRDPELCMQGHHETAVFSNNGYNDCVCIHCGDEFFMERRLRQPLRYVR